MKPPPLYYHAPTTLDEALALLRDLGDEAKVLAGGQSLMPLLNMRLARPRHLVDINGLRELDYVRPTDEGGLALGALVRHRTLEHAPIIAEHVPLLAEVAPVIGDRIVRYRGTVGGSIAHADPVAELPTVVVALDAQLIIGSHSGTRTVPASDFFVGALTTVLEPDELLVEVRFPPQPPGTTHAFLELARQHGAFAIVSVAASLTFDDGHIADARLALGGAAPIPIRGTAAEALLRGEPSSKALFSQAAQRAAAECEPSPDVHGTKEYRREMAEVYTRRALALAAHRAGRSVD